MILKQQWKVLKKMSKKRIVIVNNNLEIGGVQKALISLIKEIADIYDTTLLLFSDTGVYLNEIPQNVKVIKCNSLYKYLGISQSQCTSKKDYLIRGFLAFATRLFGRDFVLKLISFSQKKLSNKYDCAISFLHNGGKKSFYGGCNEFVLNKINSDLKIGFLHCDYSSCGANYKSNNKNYFRFDRIAACSDGCKNAFLNCLPELSHKTFVVRNCYNFEKIKQKSAEEAIVFDEKYVNIVSVARLSKEKGINRGIIAVSEAIKQSVNVKYHIVGDGIERQGLKELCKDLSIEENVVFYGNQTNPYKYMANADMLLLPSYHEAAPLVIDEARCLGLPVLTTATTSSKDMVEKTCCGWVCDNSQQALSQKLTELVINANVIKAKKEEMQNQKVTNEKALKEFCVLLEGN